VEQHSVLGGYSLTSVVCPQLMSYDILRTGDTIRLIHESRRVSQICDRSYA